MTAGKKVRVLVVEDSPATRLLLVHIINSDPHLVVSGVAGSGEEAVEMLAQDKPDVVLMDINLPGIDGFVATRRIMQTNPVPIIICSGVVSASELTTTFNALDAGAVAVIEKPVGPGHPAFEEATAKLRETLTLMAEVKVIKRWPKKEIDTTTTEAVAARIRQTSSRAVQVIAIGASTGGPAALHSVLAGMPAEVSPPVLIVQHISAGFLPGLVEWLCQTSNFTCQIAMHGEPLENGKAYFAPDDYHLGVTADGRIALSRARPENGLRPSVSYLFRSIAAAYGDKAIGILLTGMGKDGADELKLLKDAGSVTIAQNAESSIIFGMPGEAIKIGGATQVLSPEKIPVFIKGLLEKGGSNFS